MATTDVQILAKGSQPVPLNYAVAPTIEILLKMVQATFTDNGAGGDWLPCVTLISDSGDTLGRAVDQNVKVAAGGSAEVTWFPGVKNAASSAAGVSWCYLRRKGNGPSIPNDGLDHYVNIQDTISPSVVNGYFATNDTTTYLHDKITNLGVDYYGIQILKEGTYRVWVDSYWSGITAGAHGRVFYTVFPPAGKSTGTTIWNPGRTADLGVDTWDFDTGDHISSASLLSVQGSGLSLDGSIPNVPGTATGGNNAVPCTIIAVANHNSSANRSCAPSIVVERLAAGAFYFTSWVS